MITDKLKSQLKFTDSEIKCTYVLVLALRLHPARPLSAVKVRHSSCSRRSLSLRVSEALQSSVIQTPGLQLEVQVSTSTRA